MEKSRKQEEFENRLKVLQLLKESIRLWVANQVKKGIGSEEIADLFDEHCNRAKIPAEEKEQIIPYLDMALR